MASFTYERVKGCTGKVQYRTDGASAITVAGRSVKRGEVIAVKNAATERALVAGGNFAHVPADTPLGVPVVDAETPLSQASVPLSIRIRDHIAGYPSLSEDAVSRLMQLADAAESTESVSSDADPTLLAETEVLRGKIVDEFLQIQSAQTKTEEAQS